MNLDWFKNTSAPYGGELLFLEKLSKHTYYQIGGPARVLAIPKSVQDLEWLRQGIFETQCPFFVLGNGSNVLAADTGFEGLVVKISRLDHSMIPILGASEVKVGASVPVSTLLNRAGREGWGGLEFLAGVPGTIGGVVAMNAGTHLGEAASMLTAFETYSLETGERRVVENVELKFSYRRNHALGEKEIVLNATFRTVSDDPAAVAQAIQGTLTRRKQTQPLNAPSCGSVFKNPKDRKAWEVIDALGLRGYRIGNAEFSLLHCNFILNLGGATASDVRCLIQLAKIKAKTELKLELEEEVRYLGF